MDRSYSINLFKAGTLLRIINLFEKWPIIKSDFVCIWLKAEHIALLILE
jgi:hypothetical protein